jgi:fibronectin type 3 domain-containing protein
MRTNSILTTATALSMILGMSESFSNNNLLAKHHNTNGNRYYYNVLPTTTPSSRQNIVLFMSSTSTATTTEAGNFIETELRGAAMKLHTRSQAPKEGKAEEKKPKDPSYVTTHADYLQFLVDSQYVYQAFEDVVNTVDGLIVFRSTGLERVDRLETDIDFMTSEHNLERPSVGQPGIQYAEIIRSLGTEETIPEFLCHYYNFYFGK